MPDITESPSRPDPLRRGLLLGGGVVAGMAIAGAASAQSETDTAPKELNGNPVPEPPTNRSAGPVRPGRGAMLTGKVAVVTGAARGIGRAIAVEFAANGAANTIRAFAPKMVAKQRGRIIVLSSMQGLHGTKDAASYCASKWGIIGLMKSAAMEFGQYNITVNALIPGLVDTPLTRYETRLRESMEETGQKPPENPTAQQAWDVRAPTVPLKVGWLQPDDLSPAAVFLASDAAAMVTGAEYEVTGGDSAKDI